MQEWRCLFYFLVRAMTIILVDLDDRTGGWMVVRGWMEKRPSTLADW